MGFQYLPKPAELGGQLLVTGKTAIPLDNNRAQGRVGSDDLDELPEVLLDGG
tara:strand:- start:53 stop:208 length:156 start_codon:yes stop_codon:yes gene_type:complete